METDSDFEITAIHETPAETPEPLENVEIELPEAYKIEIDLTPLIELHDRIKKTDDLTELPTIEKFKAPNYAYLDPNYRRLGIASLETQQESILYDSLVYTISQMNISNSNEDFGMFCATAILHMQSDIYKNLKGRFQNEDYKDAIRNSTGEILEEAKPKELWGESLDMAVIDFLESIKDYGKEKGVFEKFKIISTADNISCDVHRLTFSETNTALIGGNESELKTLIEKEFENGILLFSSIGLDVSNKVSNISIYPPELEFVNKWEAFGYSSKGASAHIAISSINPVVQALLQDEFNIYRTIPTEQYLGHEIVHALTKYDLPVEYMEGLAVLYQMLNAETGEMNNVESVFNSISSTIDMKDGFIDRVQRISTIAKANNTQKVISTTETYKLPAAFLYILYREDPLLCGEAIKLIDAHTKLDKEIDLKEVIRVAAEYHNSKITTEDIETKAQELMEKSKRY